MKKLIMSGALAVALVAPASAAAQDPSPADFKNASKYCKALKAASGSNFSSLYKNHGKCVSATAKKNAAEDARQENQAKSNASKECKALAAQDQAAFDAKYRNHGKCVSEQARENKAEADKQDKAEDQNRINAAKQCKAERKDEAKFAADYGTKRNAFGKCVSKKAQAQNDEQPEQPAQA